jgi:hypothetical protein
VRPFRHDCKQPCILCLSVQHSWAVAVSLWCVPSPHRQLLEEFQLNRATYQAFRPLGTREEVQALRKALEEHILHGQLARYSGPRARAEVPVTPEEEEEESRRNLERLRLRMVDGTLDDDDADDTEDEGTTHQLHTL